MRLTLHGLWYLLSQNFGENGVKCNIVKNNNNQADIIDMTFFRADLHSHFKYNENWVSNLS